jgi:ATP phosphoribosyltransferase regulatory subunit HisZ
VARAAAEAGIPFPARLFYVQNVFRFSESGDREDWQCGLEYLGAPATLGDLEVVVVGCETLEALALKPVVRLGHAGISRTVAAALNLRQSNEGRALLDRVGGEGLAALAPAADGNPQIAAFIKVALHPSSQPGLLENLAALAKAELPGALAAIEEVRGVAAALSESGRSVIVDFTLPRDFDYYTGVVFEFEADGGTWGRGGRYSPTGDATPASASGLGLDLGALAVRVAPNTRSRAAVAVVPASANDFARAMSVARALHRSGIAAALASSAGDATLAVTVKGEKLVARTPEGDREMAALDDVVGLLVQFK